MYPPEPLPQRTRASPLQLRRSHGDMVDPSKTTRRPPGGSTNRSGRGILWGVPAYKLVEELTEGDMGAKIASDRLREAWLKDRRDRWLEYEGGPIEEGHL